MEDATDEARRASADMTPDDALDDLSPAEAAFLASLRADPAALADWLALAEAWTHRAASLGMTWDEYAAWREGLDEDERTREFRRVLDVYASIT